MNEAIRGVLKSESLGSLEFSGFETAAGLIHRFRDDQISRIETRKNCSKASLQSHPTAIITRFSNKRHMGM